MLVTISDRRLATDDGNGEVAYYQSDVVTANDYYPFGMGMPGRKYSENSAYRYGFNGKEKDDNLLNGSYDFGDRTYDPRICRWMAVDRLSGIYPSITPYSYALNSPLILYDPNGQWVARVDYNSATKVYSLTFVAEEGDDINILARQLGIPIGSLQKADPALATLEIKRDTEIKLEKLVEVQNINDAINNIKSRDESRTNCADLADKGDGGSNIKELWQGNNINELALKLATAYLQVEDKDARIGDILSYVLNPVHESEDVKEQKEYIKATTPPSQVTDMEDRIVGGIKEIYKDEIHYSIVILKTRDGTEIQNIIQKHGGMPIDVTDLSTSTKMPSPFSITGRIIDYIRKPVLNTTLSAYRSKEAGSKTSDSTVDASSP